MVSAIYREPLCPSEALPPSERRPAPLQSALPDLHRSYGLMRQTTFLLPAPVSLLRRVFAGCNEPLLEDGLSRRYLCNPCIGARTPTPQRPFGAYPFLPEGHRPHLRWNRFGTLSNRRNATSTTFLFRGCSHSLMFRLPCLLDPLATPTTALFRREAGPFTRRRTRAVT